MTALCSVTSIMGGFGHDLKRKILGNNAHIVVDVDRPGGFGDWEQKLAEVRVALHKAGGGAARKRKAPSAKPGFAAGAPQRLAAKASKAAANKKAPLQPAAAAAKTAVKPKKGAAKKKT